MEELDKPKVSITAIVISAVLAAVVFGGGVYAYQSNKAKKDQEALKSQITTLETEKANLEKQVADSASTTTTTQSSNSVTTTTDTVIPGTEDWKSYENKTYGINFRYPSWKLTESTTWPNTVLAISLDDVNNLPKADTGQPNLVRIEIYSAISKLDTKNLGATTLQDYLDKYSALSDPVYKNVKSLKIGNKNGYQAEAGPNQYGGGLYYFISQESNIFKIWFFDSSTSYSKETSDKFLSTFKF